MTPKPNPVEEARERLGKLATDLGKYYADYADALTWGGPTIHPQHPVDYRRAFTAAADLRTLLDAARGSGGVEGATDYARQRDLMAQALGEVLVAVGMVRADAWLTGPELLLAAETYTQAASDGSAPPVGLGEDMESQSCPSAHVADATATETPCDLEEAVRLAEIGEYLFDAKSFAAGDGYHEPRELSINWEWQQHKPDTYGEGALLAEATAWHASMAEDGVETQASRLRKMLARAPLPVLTSTPCQSEGES